MTIDARATFAEIAPRHGYEVHEFDSDSNHDTMYVKRDEAGDLAVLVTIEWTLYAVDRDVSHAATKVLVYTKDEGSSQVFGSGALISVRHLLEHGSLDTRAARVRPLGDGA